MNRAVELEPYPVAIRANKFEERSDITWLTTPLIILAVILPFMILFFVPSEYLISTMLAYVNCWLLGLATCYLASRRTVEAMLPLLGLPMFWAGWPLGNLYFAMFNRNIAMANLINRSPILFLQDNLRIQLICLVYFSIYLPIVCYVARRKGPLPRPYIANETRFATAAVVGIMLMMGPMLLGIATGNETNYVLSGLFKYGQGLLFIAGVLYPAMSHHTRLVLFTFLGAGLILTTMTSDRGIVAFPVIAAIAGALLLSSLPRRKKMIVAMTIGIGLPFFVLIGQITRDVFGKKGAVDLSAQWQVVKNWRDYQGTATPLDSLFARAHWTGGHSLVSETPEYLPYLNFNFFDYGLEAAASLLPQRFYYRPYFSGNWILKDYGHLIYEGSSVEVSTLGNAWVMGGYPTVVFCAILMGLMHAAFMLMLRRMWNRSYLKALTILGVLSSLMLICPGWDAIMHFRGLVWYTAFGWLFYQIMRIFTQADVPIAETPLSEQQHGGMADFDHPIEEYATR